MRHSDLIITSKNNRYIRTTSESEDSHRELVLGNRWDLSGGRVGVISGDLYSRLLKNSRLYRDSDIKKRRNIWRENMLAIRKEKRLELEEIIEKSFQGDQFKYNDLHFIGDIETAQTIYIVTLDPISERKLKDRRVLVGQKVEEEINYNAMCMGGGADPPPTITTTDIYKLRESKEFRFNLIFRRD
tara:strand:- start:10564 stop:11121 length:558 start_codon:yes stop_codon:yes gene_type:complete